MTTKQRIESEVPAVTLVGTKRWKETVPVALQQPLAEALRAMEEHRTGDALMWFGKCADIDPFSKPVLYFGGQVAAQAFFSLRGREEAPAAELEQWRAVAETLVRSAAEVAPDDAVAIHNVGRFLQDVQEDAEAVGWYQRALAIDAGQAESWGNMGTAFYQLGQVAKAWEAWDACLRCVPDKPSACLSQAYIHFREGRRLEGWQLFAERWKDLEFSRNYGREAEFDAIHWTGQPLRARDTVLVHGEQGLGDHVQFARYIRRAVADGYRVSGIETRPVLKRWMQGCFPDIPVYARGFEEVPTHSHHVSMMDLPLLCAGEIVAPVAPAVEPRHLVTDGTRAIGIAWEGAKGNPADAMRSVPAECLQRLANIPNVTWVSLQFTKDAGMYAKAWLGSRVVDAAAEPADTLDTARVIAGLEQVVTVDTLTAHLAGSLGVKTTILHRFAREWRWGDERVTGEMCPWYPSARSWTVPAPNDWPSLLDRVRSDLERGNL